jgi:ElaB/YqjD/DUF883 family membrane-anchored ribosome-binding protein
MSPDNPQSGKRGPKAGGRSLDDNTMGAGFDADAPSRSDTDPLYAPAASSVPGYQSSGTDSASFGATGSGTGYGTSSATGAARATDSGQQASGIFHQVRQKAASQLNEQKTRATDSLGSVADAVRQSTRQLRDQQFDTVAQVVERAADQIERLSNHLRQRDLNELVAEAQQFARQQPAMFIGSSFAAGLLAARFIKASRPAESYANRAYDSYGGETLAGGGMSEGGTYGGGTTYSGGTSYDRTSSYNTSVDRPGDVTGRGEV